MEERVEHSKTVFQSAFVQLDSVETTANLALADLIILTLHD
jgi:hypothetical protein